MISSGSTNTTHYNLEVKNTQMNGFRKIGATIILAITMIRSNRPTTNNDTCHT